MESTISALPYAPVTRSFRLIETFAHSAEAGFVRGGRHIERMGRSARALGIPFDAVSGLEVLQGVARAQGNTRCRLTLDREGRFELTTAPLADAPKHWTLSIATQRLHSTNPWLRHKTTQRAPYDQARANLPDGVDEVIFLNEHDEFCEGTITNLFVETANGWVTPPLECGLLPGILREELLESGELREQVVTRDMLGGRVAVGNSLRGWIPASWKA